MPLFGTRGAASVTGFGGLAKLGYLLRNSLRFRASNSAYLSRTGTTATNAKVATYSFWMKRGILSTGTQWLFTGGGSGAVSLIGFNAGADTLSVFNSDTSAEGNITTAVFRDPAAWYHVVIRINTTEGSAADRAKIYVNGVQQAVSVNNSGIGLDSSWNFNTAQTLNIGRYTGASGYSDVYLAEVYFIDGIRDVSAFAKTDPATGQWIPIKYAGTYGNNGFYLNFTDASAATAAAIGKDSSGNGNNWTPNNISVTAGTTYDSMTDVPTLTSATVANYATLNPLSMAANLVLNSGNLAVSNSNGADTHRIVRAGIGMTTGKWYWEVHVNNSANVDIVGVADDTTGNAGNNYLGGTGKSAGWGYNTSTGAWYQGPWTVNSPTPPAFPSSGIIGVAYDADAGNLWFSSNGSWLSANGGTGNPAAGSNPNLSLAGTAGTPFYPALSIYSNGGTWTFNFGQRPFAYSSNLSGFKALNTYNLP